MKKDYKKRIMISCMAIFLILIGTVGAVTLSQMQTKLQNINGVTNVIQTSSNILEYTYTGFVSKISNQYNATLGYNVTQTKVYNGSQQVRLTIINPKRVNIQLLNENLTLIP